MFDPLKADLHKDWIFIPKKVEKLTFAISGYSTTKILKIGYSTSKRAKL